jgi:hypothetical protein
VRQTDLDRRGFIGFAAPAVAALSTGTEAMAQTLEEVTRSTRTDGEIRPFSFTAAETELVDLRRRLDATKWPEREWVKDSPGRSRRETR